MPRCPECNEELRRNTRLRTVYCLYCGYETEDPHVDHDDYEHEPPWDTAFGDDDGPEGAFLCRL